MTVLARSTIARSRHAFELGDGGGLGVDLFDPRAGLDHFVLLFGVVDLRLAGFHEGLGVVDFAGGDGGFDGDEAFVIAFGVFEIDLGFFELGLGLGDFFGAAAGLEFREAGLGVVELALLLGDAGFVIIVFQAHENLAFGDLVSHFDADPGDAADNFAGEFDFVGGDDVAGGVEEDEVVLGGGAFEGRTRRVSTVTILEAWRNCQKAMPPPSEEEDDGVRPERRGRRGGPCGPCRCGVCGVRCFMV